MKLTVQIAVSNPNEVGSVVLRIVCQADVMTRIGLWVELLRYLSEKLSQQLLQKLSQHLLQKLSRHLSQKLPQQLLQKLYIKTVIKAGLRKTIPGLYYAPE